MTTTRTILVTGATGLVGRGAVGRMLAAMPALQVHAVARDPRVLASIAAADGWGERVVPLAGDVTRPGLGLDASARALLEREADAVLHCAADTTFSRLLADARRTNTTGTANVLDLVASWRRQPRVAYVSTAFVAGRTTGLVPATVHDGADGWVNGYEQSKWEAEALVREHAADWVILRPSTIVCDADGTVRQVNAVHRALRIYHAGLAAMLPWAPGATLEVVPGDWVCDAVARLALAPEHSGRSFHLCAGSGALPIAEMLDRTWRAWSGSDAEWRRRTVARPALADLETWTLFERSVHETGNARLGRVLGALSHFVPHLALPKRFDTTSTEDALGAGAPAARDYWDAMVTRLAADRWVACDVVAFSAAGLAAGRERAA
jgi:nucleoside-diphosphate-sugar epimerase